MCRLCVQPPSTRAPVGRTLQRFGDSELLERAEGRDPGFAPELFTEQLNRVRRLDPRQSLSTTSPQISSRNSKAD